MFTDGLSKVAEQYEREYDVRALEIEENVVPKKRRSARTIAIENGLEKLWKWLDETPRPVEWKSFFAEGKCVRKVVDAPEKEVEGSNVEQVLSTCAASKSTDKDVAEFLGLAILESKRKKK